MNERAAQTHPSGATHHTEKPRCAAQFPVRALLISRFGIVKIDFVHSILLEVTKAGRNLNFPNLSLSCAKIMLFYIEERPRPARVSAQLTCSTNKRSYPARVPARRVNVKALERETEAPPYINQPDAPKALPL